MFFKKPKRYKAKTHPHAAMVNWIVVGFLAFGLTRNYVTHGTIAPESSRDELKKSLSDVTPDIPLNLESYQDMLFSTREPIRIRDLKHGEGQPLVCGQKAIVAYKVYAGTTLLGDDTATAENPLSFRIGEHKVMPALELGVVGMFKGGRRVITASGRDAYRAPGFVREDIDAEARITFEVELIDAQPPLPDAGENPYSISEASAGAGKLLLCGNPVKVTLTVKNREGQALYSSPADRPFIFHPGQSEAFLGLEQGVIGMRAGGKRSLVVPPGFQKTMDGKAGAPTIPFPPGQTVLVDVEALP
jgi:FKBP-type peptidyl-prolyl cis-trans isomerase